MTIEEMSSENEETEGDFGATPSSLLDNDGIPFYQHHARDLNAAERERLAQSGVCLHERRRYTAEEDDRIRKNWRRFAKKHQIPDDSASTFICHGTSLAEPEHKKTQRGVLKQNHLVAALCRKLPHRTGASTQHFSQTDIDGFREAFYLYAQKGSLDSSSHLRYIMRCLGYSPTVQETQQYFRDKRGKVNFACFLEILYQHSQKDNPMKEILQAFRAHDRSRVGIIPAKELKAILTGMGEHMSPQEVDRMLKEANIHDPKAMVRYEDLVRAISIPLPDY